MKLVECEHCHGEGQVTDLSKQRLEGNFVHYGKSTCVICGGTGSITVFKKEPQSPPRENRKKEKQPDPIKKGKPKPLTKPKPTEPTNIGVSLGLITFFVIGAFSYFGLEKELLTSGIIGAILGIIIRYTYKLIVLVIIAIAAYYIYDNYMA